MLFLGLGLLMSWVKMLAGIGAAVAIRNSWASVGIAVAVAILNDLWPMLDMLLMLDGYVVVTMAMSAAGVLVWWALGRALVRMLRRAVLVPGGAS